MNNRVEIAVGASGERPHRRDRERERELTGSKSPSQSHPTKASPFSPCVVPFTCATKQRRDTACYSLRLHHIHGRTWHGRRGIEGDRNIKEQPPPPNESPCAHLRHPDPTIPLARRQHPLLHLPTSAALALGLALAMASPMSLETALRPLESLRSAWCPPRRPHLQRLKGMDKRRHECRRINVVLMLVVV